VKKYASHVTTTAKLMSDLNPLPKLIKNMVIAACNIIAFTGVFKDVFKRPNIEGRKPSFPATKMILAAVKNEPDTLGVSAKGQGNGQK
jgi:hypothetical protein